MKIFAVLFLLSLLSPPGFAQEPEGVVIFSVEITDSQIRKRMPDGTVVDIGKTGIFYYLKPATPDQPLTITGYQFGDGNVVDVFGRGISESENLIAKLRSLPLSTFDVAADVEKATAVAREQAEQRGETYSPPVILDGAEYKLTYEFNDVSISYEAWNPGPLLEDLAPYSTNMANLKELIDLFATEYGRAKFGL